MARYLIPVFFLFCALSPAQNREYSDFHDPAEAKVFRVNVNLVQVDAVVTDKDGRPVIDLTADDFVILQDGKPQEITNFSLVRTSAPVVPGATVKKPAPESREDSLPPPPSSVRLKENQVRRVLALVVDDLGLSFSNTVHVRESLRKWVDEEMQPGDLVAVITTGAGMSGLQQFTGDKKILYNAIDHIRFNVLSRTGSASFQPVSEANVSLPEEETIRRLLGTLEVLRYVASSMGTFPGRKSLMFFSEHMQIHFDDGGIMDMSLSDLVKEKLDQLTRDANRAAVVLYTIDPRGAVWTETTAADTLTLVNAGGPLSKGASVTISADAIAERRQKQWIKSQEGLFILPDETGGRYIRHHNYVELALQEAVNDGEFYYLIGYRPDAKTVAEMRDNRNKFHNIKVRVTRSGLDVRSRSGFFSTTETPYAPAPSGDTLTQAMLSPLLQEGLTVRLASGYVYDFEGIYRLRAWVHLPGRQLTVLRDENGGNYISLETYAATTGFDGLIRDADRMEHRIPLTTQDILSVREQGLRFSVTIPAKDPGAYFVRLSVKDQGSGKIGSAYQYIEIPDLQEEGLSLSDLFTLGRNEDIRRILSNTAGESAERLYSTGENHEKSPAIRQYRPGESVEYLVLIYNAETRRELPPDLETQTVLYRDGSEIFRSDPETVDVSGIGDPARIPIKKRLRLGKTIPPGDYILQLQVRDKLAKKERSLAARSLDFQVIPETEPSNLEKAAAWIHKGNQANREDKKEEAAQAFAEAARSYREELQKYPDDTVLWKQTGTVYHLAGETEQAVAAYEEAVRLQPDDAESHYMLAIIRATADVESAIGDFREAIRLHPDIARYHFDLGRALTRIKDFDASMEAFREACRLDPEDGECHASMGIVLQQTGEIEEAAAEYRKALALDLSDGSAENIRQLLKKVLAEGEDPDAEKRREYYTLKAKQWREAVEQHIPGKPDAAAVEVGSWPVEDLNIILYLAGNIREGKLNPQISYRIIHLFNGSRYIKKNILPFLDLTDDSQQLLKRAALLHTDIAMLQLDTGYAPEAIVVYQDGFQIVDSSALLVKKPRAPFVFPWERVFKIIKDAAISIQDGRGTVVGKGWHWRFARYLLDGISPHPSEDEMVRKWYVASTAFMLSNGLFAYVENNIVPALQFFSSDPVLLFYSGVLHENYAGSTFQNALSPEGEVYPFESEKSELKKAREYFQKTLKADPEFSEARLHLGRVTGLLGDHEEAVEELRKAADSITDTQLRYYCSLYLGNELAGLNRGKEACEQFETATKLYPNAQSPLLSLSRLALSSGDYENAFFFGKLIFNLPAEEDTSGDPWWSYDVSPVLDASSLISEMYEAARGITP
ncbi:MAG: VWA domain-containing protein [Sedimentisphaerales bacterium]|nr:VWA domain-containing protein [Sedimentisphaerales bacterium]